MRYQTLGKEAGSCWLPMLGFLKGYLGSHWGLSEAQVFFFKKASFPLFLANSKKKKKREENHTLEPLTRKMGD